MRLMPWRVICVFLVVWAVSPAWAAPGDLDLTYGIGGIVLGPGSATTDAVIQSDGKLLVVTLGIIPPPPSLARYLVDGSLDPTFGNGGVVSARADVLAVQADGKILTVTRGHGADPVPLGAIRRNPDGSFDTSLRTGFGSSALGASSHVVTVQPDGRVIVAGAAPFDFLLGNSLPRLVLARFEPDGSLDSTFGVDGKVLAGDGTSGVASIALQPDGRIVAVGNEDVIFRKSLDSVAMARFEPDGGLDASFGNAGFVTVPTDARSERVAIQSTGRIIVAGYTRSDPRTFLLAGYDSSGALDPSFGIAGVVTTAIGATSEIADILIQPDDRIVAVGTSEGSRFAVVYYLPDGQLDPSFGSGGIVTTAIGGVAVAKAVAQEPWGKIIVAGTSDDVVALARYEVPPFCGDTTIDPGEACDAGTANGSTACCSRTCTIRAAGEICRPSTAGCDAADTCDGVSTSCPLDAPQPDGTPCDDGDACTANDACTVGTCGAGAPVTCASCEICDPAIGCHIAPKPDCRRPVLARKARLTVRDRTPDRRDRLVWKWLKGAPTTPADFGDPVASDDYTLCIYDESGPQPQAMLTTVIPPGGVCRDAPCWKPGKAGVRYRDRDHSVAGIDTIVLRGGGKGKAKIILKARGENLSLPPLPLALPVRVQLQGSNGRCWEATYSADQFQTNTATEFKGKAD